MNEKIKEMLYKLDYITERTESDILVNDYADELKNNITKLQKENKKLKEELLNKPDTKWTLTTKDGQELTIIQSERIDMQVELNKSINELASRINEAIEFLKEYHNYENRFKWCEQDYIQTINRVEKILQGDDKK